MTFVSTVYRQVTLVRSCKFYKCLKDSFYLPSSALSGSSSKMSKKKVYLTRPDIPASGLEILKERCEVTSWNEERPVTRSELLMRIQGVDALFCMLTDKIDKEVLDKAGPNLKVIGTMSVGYDHIDLAEVKARGIRLGYTPDVLTDAVAELTVALLLATSRRLFEAHQQIIEGKWSAWAPTWMCGPGLNHSTVGVVGFGRIGQEVARRLKTFNVAKILYSGRSDKPEARPLGAERVPLDLLLSQSDFVIVACALTPETKEMFNDEAFAKMKPTAIFVNTSRGGVVDQPALQRALENGIIRAAGLDVMTPEPLPPDHPLLKLKNCVILPHIGSATLWARNEMSKLTARNILAGLDGQPMPEEVK